MLAVLSIFTGGCALVKTAGIRGWGVPFLGFIAGSCLLVTIGLLQVVLHLPTTPVLTLALTGAVPVAGWAVRQHLARDVPIAVLPAVLSVLVVVALVAGFRQVTILNWTTDSFRYLMTGSTIANGTYHDLVTPNLLTKRLIGTPILHAPANLAGEFFLRSIAPLLGLCILAVTAWFVQQGVRNRPGRAWTFSLAALGVLLLLTNSRFLFHSFYLNGHLFVAATLLIIGGCGWLLLARAQVPVPALFALPAVAIPALVVTRAETSIVALVALLPLVLSDRISLRIRSGLLVVLGASVTLWQGYVLIAFRAQGVESKPSVSGLLLLGVLILLLIPLLRWRALLARPGAALLLVEVGTWLALLGLAARNPQILSDSVSATAQNVVDGAGSWGASLIILAFLVAGVTICLKAPGLASLRFPVTTFLPLGFLFAYLRDSAYRVGDGDSLNRMLIHMVPLAVVYVVAAIATGGWRFAPRTTGQSGPPDRAQQVGVPAGNGPRLESLHGRIP